MHAKSILIENKTNSDTRADLLAHQFDSRAPFHILIVLKGLNSFQRLVKLLDQDTFVF